MGELQMLAPSGRLVRAWARANVLRVFSNAVSATHGEAVHARRPFTHFIRCRPDMHFMQPMPHAAFEPTAITLRAYAILFATECSTISHWALEGPPTCRGNALGHAQGDSTSDKEYAGLPGTRAIMRSMAVGVCAKLDDMLAVTPRHLSAAYFLTHASLRTWTPRRALPWGHDINASRGTRKAVQGTYGQPFSLKSYLRACGTSFAVTRAEASSTYSELARKNSEKRITSRVHARLVPFKITAFPVYESFHAVHICTGHCKQLNSTWYC